MIWSTFAKKARGNSNDFSVRFFAFVMLIILLFYNDDAETVVVVATTEVFKFFVELEISTVKVS